MGVSSFYIPKPLQWTALFVRDGNTGAGSWLRLSEDFTDSNTQRYVTPIQSTITRVTFSSATFPASTQQIEIYVGGVLSATIPLTSGVLQQSFNLNLAVAANSLIGVFIRRTAGAGNVSDPAVHLYGL